MNKARPGKATQAQKRQEVTSLEEEPDLHGQAVSDANSTENAEENSRFQHLHDAKQSFLRELNDPRTKHMSPEDKLNSLIIKAEKLASFLLTKHKIFELNNKKKGENFARKNFNSKEFNLGRHGQQETEERFNQ